MNAKPATSQSRQATSVSPLTPGWRKARVNWLVQIGSLQTLGMGGVFIVLHELRDSQNGSVLLAGLALALIACVLGLTTGKARPDCNGLLFRQQPGLEPLFYFAIPGWISAATVLAKLVRSDAFPPGIPTLYALMFFGSLLACSCWIIAAPWLARSNVRSI